MVDNGFSKEQIIKELERKKNIRKRKKESLMVKPKPKSSGFLYVNINKPEGPHMSEIGRKMA